MSELSNKKVSEVKECVLNEIENMKKNCEFNRIEEMIKALDEDGRVAVRKLSLKCAKEKEKWIKEIKRVQNLYRFDIENGEGIVAGVDEVGRGPLAGPIVAAAVVLDYSKIDPNSIILGINDSKKIKESQRERLYDIICEEAVDYKIAIIDNRMIDQNGIGWCNNEIFKEAVLGLDVKPDKVLCDGYAIKNFNVNSQAVIKGDTKSAAIACASILAKVYRDRIMKEFSVDYPEYDFGNNVGYGTGKHIAALKEHGYTDIHRMTFIKNFI